MGYLSRVESLEAAIQCDPSVALARIMLAEALERKNAKMQPKNRDPRIPAQAAFLREYEFNLKRKMERSPERSK